MTKETLIRNYRKYSMANAYIVGFTFDHMLYFFQTNEIAPRFLNKEMASRNQGENLRLRLKANQKKQLIKKSICLGSDLMLQATKYNKGEIFEKIITEYFGQVWEKDNIPFYEQGDINVNGVEIQIKLDSATLCNSKQIEKLKRA